MSFPGDRPVFVSPSSSEAGKPEELKEGKTEELKVGKAGSKRVREASPDDSTLLSPKIHKPDDSSSGSRQGSVTPVESQGEELVFYGESEFEEAVAFAHACADCGTYSEPLEDYLAFNSEEFPDYGTSMLILFAAIVQKAYCVSRLEEMLEEVLQQHDYGNINAKEAAAQLYALPAATTAEKMEEEVRKCFSENAEQLMHSLRNLHYSKGYMDCIHDDSDAGESSDEDSYHGSEPDSDTDSKGV